MVNFPWDIVSEILVRLPAKSIARFRCVNKAWCNVLKNPEFLKRQYKHAVELNRISLLFHDYNGVYTTNYDPSSSTCESSGPTAYNGIYFIGCCNGLVLLRLNNALILWNPLTTECKKLPNPGTRWNRRDYLIGYDHRIEDFKVVCMAPDLYDNWCEVQVYTLRSNSWRRLEDIQIIMRGNIRIRDMSRLPFNGGLHWKAFRGDTRTEFILRFDFEKEEFDQLPTPDVGNHDNINHQVCLSVFGGSLWFLNKYGCNLEFWEWKDNGVEKSWIHPFTLDIGKLRDMDDLSPLRLVGNGKIVLLDNGKTFFCVRGEDFYLRFVLYDPVHETTRTLKTCEGISNAYCPTFVYVESLISLDTGTYLGQVQWEEEEEDDEERDYDDVVPLFPSKLEFFNYLYEEEDDEERDYS